MLDDLGLFPALVWQLARFTRQTGVEVDFVHSGLEGRRLPAAIALVAYRIVQEALTNVARHSGAGSAAVRLSAVNGLLHGEVEDKGVGYEPERLLSPTSIGLAGMRERAELVGGRIRGESLAGVGTRLTFELPLPDGESLGGP
jgi:signal transduction histidine kinase